MKVLILCGGKGIRLFTDSDYIPKAMVKLGHRPIVWHVMKRYALYGYTDFILALGRNGEMIREYFLNYDAYANDVTVDLANGSRLAHTENQEADWKVTLVDTGDEAQSGARISRCRRYVEDHSFMVSYADCLADVDIAALLAHHKNGGKVATITGALPPYREGEFIVDKNGKISLYDMRRQKKDDIRRFYNGGFMVFDKKIFSYLSPFGECKLETDIFPRLIEDGQLGIYPHYGFWRWLDTDRDYLYLQELVDKNQTHWLQE